MRTTLNCLVLFVIPILMGRVACAQDVGVEAAQTAEGATLRGGGAYLKGLGWYNVTTAQANAINVDTTIKWQRELRRFAEEKRGLDARRLAGKTLRIEDVKRRQQAREQQLRTSPSGEDVVSGEALNVLLFDLTDPDLTTDKWLAKPVLLPDGMSVKDVTFQFMPVSVASDSSKALSRGVIALSRLDIKEKWPTALSVDALESERTSYEKAFAKIRDQVLAGKLTVDALIALDRTLDSLRAKVQTAVPMERGFRVEATRFVEDLKNATRMFDASTVEYAKEILLDTQDHDAKTVFELVRFMLKYRLQFASTQRSPSGRVLYTQLYELMSQQLKALGGGLGGLGGGAGAGGLSDPFQPNTVWTDGGLTLTVTDRKGDTFQAKFETDDWARIVKGTVKNNLVKWLGKDAQPIKGGTGGDNTGTVSKDGGGDKIDFMWSQPNGKTGTFTLRRKP